jgi:hypothetical protein
MKLQEYPKEIILKEGTKVVLRPMVKDDENELMPLFSNLPKDEWPYICEEDLNPGLAKILAERIDHVNIPPILAMDKDRIVGIATLHRDPFSTSCHVGNIQITVSPSYRWKKLGSILAGEIFINSVQNGFEKIVAEIVVERSDVRQFYIRLGFHTEATLIDHYIDAKGIKHDVIIMSNDPNTLWKRWVEYFEEITGKQRTQLEEIYQMHL